MAKRKNNAIREEELVEETAGSRSQKSNPTKSNATTSTSAKQSGRTAVTSEPERVTNATQATEQSKVNMPIGATEKGDVPKKTKQNSVSKSAYEPDVAAQYALEDGANVQQLAPQAKESAQANGDVVDVAKPTVSVMDDIALPTVKKEKPKISSQAEAEKALSDYTYIQSDAVKDAYVALEDYLSEKPTEYVSSYQEQIDDLLDQIVNRDAFAYDFDADPLYQQYKNQYQHAANLAMQDTMAEMQSATGGYGSSYAAQAASGAYQSQMNELNGVMPELYQLAYGVYSDAGDVMRENLSAMTTQEEVAQNLYQNLLDDYYTGLDEVRETAENAYEKDYGQYQDTTKYWQELLGYYADQTQQDFDNNQTQLEYELALKEYEESVRQFNEELAAQKSEFEAEQNQWWTKYSADQAAAAQKVATSSANSGGSSHSSGGSASSSSASGGSSTSGTTSNTANVMSAYAQDLKRTITQEMRNYAASGETDVNEQAKGIIETYYRNNMITKAEANAIGAAYGVTF